MRLTAKYAPLAINQFVGLDEPKKIVNRWLASPDERAFLFVGDSGTGKTKMGESIARALGIQVDSPEAHYSFIHVASQKCTVAIVQEIQERLAYAPWASFWVVLIDEADQMSPAAQIAFLSLLDSIPQRTVIIFTSNDTERLEPRFLSRCMVVKFSNYGLNGAGAAFLSDVWSKELAAGSQVADSAPLFPDAKPDFSRILKNSRNNLRDALMVLERELLSA